MRDTCTGRDGTGAGWLGAYRINHSANSDIWRLRRKEAAAAFAVSSKARRLPSEGKGLWWSVLSFRHSLRPWRRFHESKSPLAGSPFRGASACAFTTQKRVGRYSDFAGFVLSACPVAKPWLLTIYARVQLTAPSLLCGASFREAVGQPLLFGRHPKNDQPRYADH